MTRSPEQEFGTPAPITIGRRLFAWGERTFIMGIVNVTPDSFSGDGLLADAMPTSNDAPDAGEPSDPTVAAVAQARSMVAQGADLLDVGGESTRPGAEPVDADAELARVLPVVAALVADQKATLSIDTSKQPVAEAALDAGARYVNDVTAFRADPRLAGLVADRGVECCLMHMLGEPRTMQDDPRYDDVVSDVKAFLEERLAFAVGEGIREDRIALDPGIGFGKTVDHNLELLRRLDEIAAIGRPVVIGTSRKSFLGRITGRDVTERGPASLATCVVAYLNGARVFRVHEVASTRDALLVTAATVTGRWSSTTTAR
jgi:dihydropteroate synthase